MARAMVGVTSASGCAALALAAIMAGCTGADEGGRSVDGAAAGTGGVGGTIAAGTGGGMAGSGGTAGAGGVGGMTAGTGGSAGSGSVTGGGIGGTVAGTGGMAGTDMMGTGGIGAVPPSTSHFGDFTCPGGTIVPGVNTIMVGGRARVFNLELPSNTSGPMGLVFSWHGYNQDNEAGHADFWPAEDRIDPNANPSLPLAVIIPDDVDFDPPIGLDWQLDKGNAATNIDLAFFEAMAGCMNAQYDVDPARVYSFGFSAGSVISSLLHSAYPYVFSAVICSSGMWFNDKAELDMLWFLGLQGEWPALDENNIGTVLLTHGGPNDQTVASIANLENMAQAAFPFLKEKNRVVIDCAHNDGHTLHPQIGTAELSKFFSDHRNGEESPYLSGGFTGYPGSCTLRLP